MTATDAGTEQPPPAVKRCTVTGGDVLGCTERDGHRNDGWHYDEIFDTTWRPGCYLPRPIEQEGH